jgi:hypothetical protein
MMLDPHLFDSTNDVFHGRFYGAVSASTYGPFVRLKRQDVVKYAENFDDGQGVDLN